MPETEGYFELKEECLFWLAILRDHGQFMYLAFPPSEKADAKEAQYYAGVFADLRQRVAGGLPEKLLSEIRNRVEDFRKYQQDVLHRLLTCSVGFNLPPLVLEETIDEAREFLLILDHVIPEKNPVLQDMHEHLMWLWNFTAHADAILMLLDPVEAIILTRAREFKKLFMALFYKAYSYGKMIKSRPECLANLIYLNREATTTSQEFIEYMGKLKCDVEECRVLGILPALLLDHMIREAHYYIGKIRGECPKDSASSGTGADSVAALGAATKKLRLWPAKNR